MLKFLAARRAKEKARQDRLDVLDRILLGEDKTTRKTPAAKIAIAYCEKMISEYNDLYELNESRWIFYQRVVIIGGVVATLAGVMTIPSQWLPLWLPAGELGWLRGVPAALVTIAAGLLSSFTYREDAVRHAVTATALWNELSRFQSLAAPYDGDERKATSAFSNTVTRLIEKEAEGWRALVMSTRAETDTPTKSQRRTTTQSGTTSSI